ncbi:hypothetical protein GTH32_10925 [Alteromonas sp. 345S023]|uniref:Papain-like cysteine peptidase n=1 Tax=Alteromonas profundi TaxID=2696062 RepID=A0A7X5RLG1_9ALTE|nr:hypothetical protein [Alteromonas profundi]NDV91696.1 hypothetical protein [Alteromonas profundi]
MNLKEKINSELIPLGAWCRTAYQVNEFKKNNDIETTSFPYDWTITPFSALKSTLNSEFDPYSILRYDVVERSELGSLVDTRTKIIHHHDFPATKLKLLEEIAGVNDKGLPFELYKTDLLDNAKSRFCHTYKNLEFLKKEQKRLLFVRWQRSGHPDRQLPNAFENESILSLSTIIKGFLRHDNFSILVVKSKTIIGDLPENIITEYNREEFGVTATIIERKGFNGDGTNSFKGDEVSWRALLTRFVIEEE